MISICGIDPGKQGGLAFKDGNKVQAVSFSTLTQPEIAHKLREFMPEKVYLEKAQPMRKPAKKGKKDVPQGVVSAFTYGEGFGHLKGVLDTLGIPYELITPRTWQTALNCLTGGDKNVTKTKAQQLFPMVPKITHYIADALLIMEYGCRLEKQGE